MKVSRPVEQQSRSDHQHATAELQRQRRLVWSKEDNKVLFECYIRSKPERRGCRKRLVDLWRVYSVHDELKNVSEQSRDLSIKSNRKRPKSGLRFWSRRKQQSKE